MAPVMKAKIVARTGRVKPSKFAKSLLKKKEKKLVKVLDEKTLTKQRGAELNQLSLAELEKLHFSNALGTEPVASVIARSKDNLGSKQISDLKELCEKNKLKVGGSKGELIERLLDSEKGDLKIEMVKTLVSFEAKTRADARASELKVREIVNRMRKDFGSKTNQELKDICVSKGLKPGASKKDSVERIVSRAREDGEVEKVLAAKVRDERRDELLAMDENALMELCRKRGVNPLVKAIMVDRLLLSESVA